MHSKLRRRGDEIISRDATRREEARRILLSFLEDVYFKRRSGMILSDKEIKREVSIIEIKNSHLEANAKIRELVNRTFNVYKVEKRLMKIMDEVDGILRDLAASADSLYDAAELKDALGDEKEEV